MACGKQDASVESQQPVDDAKWCELVWHAVHQEQFAACAPPRRAAGLFVYYTCLTTIQPGGVGCTRPVTSRLYLPELFVYAFTWWQWLCAAACWPLTMTLGVFTVQIIQSIRLQSSIVFHKLTNITCIFGTYRGRGKGHPYMPNGVGVSVMSWPWAQKGSHLQIWWKYTVV